MCGDAFSCGDGVAEPGLLPFSATLSWVDKMGGVVAAAFNALKAASFDKRVSLFKRCCCCLSISKSLAGPFIAFSFPERELLIARKLLIAACAAACIAIADMPGGMDWFDPTDADGDTDGVRCPACFVLGR